MMSTGTTRKFVKSPAKWLFTNRLKLKVITQWLISARLELRLIISQNSPFSNKIGWGLMIKNSMRIWRSYRLKKKFVLRTAFKKSHKKVLESEICKKVTDPILMEFWKRLIKILLPHKHLQKQEQVSQDKLSMPILQNGCSHQYYRKTIFSDRPIVELIAALWLKAGLLVSPTSLIRNWRP